MKTEKEKQIKIIDKKDFGIKVLKDFNDIGIFFKASQKPFIKRFDFNKYHSYFQDKETQGYIKILD